MLVAFEGIDGSGKTTTARLLPDMLRQLGFPATYVDKRHFDCDDHYVSEHLAYLSEIIWKRSRNRPIRLLGEEHWIYLNAAYFSALFEAVKKLITNRGEIVVMDGWIYKFAARAGASSKLGIERVLAQVPNLSAPDLVVLLDVTPDEALRRRKEFSILEQGGYSGGTGDFLAFQGAVHAALRRTAQTFGWRIEVPLGRSAEAIGRSVAEAIAARIVAELAARG